MVHVIDRINTTDWCLQGEERHQECSFRDTTSKPHRIVADSLNNVPEDVNNHLPEPPSLKRTIQRKRKIDTVTANPDLALACDRSFLLLRIPQTLLRSWKYFDSGPSDSRILILTTDSNLDFLCQSFEVVWRWDL